MTIVNDDSSIVNKQSFKFIDDARVVIYNRNRFIIRATGFLSVYQSYLCASVCLYVLPSLGESIYLPACLFVCLYISSFVYLSVYMF